jgi:hypothetical protein
LILLDYSQTAIANIMAELGGRTDVVLNIQVVRHMILNSIRSYNVKFRKEFGEMVICCDSKNYWRKKIFPNYKSNRKKERAESKIDWASIFEGLNIVKEDLETVFPYPVISVDTAEGDDAIATLVIWSQTHDLVEGNALTEAMPQKNIILSKDHDFLTLQKYEGVRQYSPIDKKDLVIQDSYEATLMETILYGCKGDGVPRFLDGDDSLVNGERASTIMKTKLDEWKKMTMEEVACDPYLTKNHMSEELLKNMKRNKALVDLHEIPTDVQEQIIQSYLGQRGVRNRSKLMNYFVKNGMKQMVEKMGDF